MATTMAPPLRPATLLPALTPVWLVCMAWVSVPTAHAQSAAPLPEPQALRCPAPSSVREALRASGPQQTPPQQTPPRRPAQPATTGTTPTLVVGDDPRIEISSDSATLGVDGDAVLKGDVRVIQGERTLSAEDVTYDAEKNLFKVEGTVRYVEPSLEVSGRGGSYDPAGGAAFEAATFALPERPARGAAERMELEADGDIRLQQVWFSTCPAEHPDWRATAPAAMPPWSSRACRSCTCPGSRSRWATSARAAFCSRASATAPAAVPRSASRTTSTSRRTTT
jgi:lipopolysaccharide assembly outer membrane protein LptD (OstA)